jgi:hypothetical protein
MSRTLLLVALLLLSSGALVSCNPNRDTDQLSTESPSTRNSTAENPDSSSLPVDSTALVR